MYWTKLHYTIVSYAIINTESYLSVLSILNCQYSSHLSVSNKFCWLSFSNIDINNGFNNHHDYICCHFGTYFEFSSVISDFEVRSDWNFKIAATYSWVTARGKKTVTVYFIAVFVETILLILFDLNSWIDSFAERKTF